MWKPWHICALVMALFTACGRFKGSITTQQGNPETHCDRLSGPFGGGDGSRESPYLICTTDHLAGLSLLSGKAVHVSLQDDLDLDGLRVLPIETWSGTFLGNQRTLVNYQAEEPLFREITGTVESLRFENLGVHGIADDTGGVTRKNHGTLRAIYVQGTVNSSFDRTGGIAGTNTGTISLSRFEGRVSGAQHIGGIAGTSAGTLELVTSYADIDGTFDFVGGIAGSVDSGKISKGKARGTLQGRNYVGGIVGRLGGKLENSYASASVFGEQSVGGIVGMLSGSVFFCYANSPVSGKSVGGLVGTGSLATVTRSYWNSAMASGSAGGTPKSLEELGLSETYEDWDFSLTWFFGENGLPDLF